MPTALTTVTEFADQGGMFPSSITTGPDGNVWFMTAGGRIYRAWITGSALRCPLILPVCVG